MADTAYSNDQMSTAKSKGGPLDTSYLEERRMQDDMPPMLCRPHLGESFVAMLLVFLIRQIIISLG